MIKDIKGYEGIYQIDENGNVYSVLKKMYKSTFLSHNGYKRIALWHNGTNKKYFIHRLVAETFINNPNEYETVDHIDRNILNNNIYNLRWATREFNSARDKAKLSKENVEYIKSHYKRGNGTELSQKFNCDLSMIVKIAKNKSYSWI